MQTIGIKRKSGIIFLILSRSDRMVIQRPEYINFLKDWKEQQIIKVVTGIRRCGKSTLFDLYRDYLYSTGVEEK